MSYHLKRLTAPVSWHIAKKEEKFVTKTSPGPHSGAAMPVAVWLRDKMGLAGNMKEVKRILNQRQVILNGKPVTDPKLGLGIFDIISIPKIGKHYRVLTDKKGRMVTIEIDAEAAKTRLCKIRNKSIVRGGKVQLNLRFGANIIADNTYKSGDSVVISLEPETRFKIVGHFPFAVGNMAMITGGKHSGKVARILEIIKVPGSVPNKILLEDETTGTKFDTVSPYVYMVGTTTPAIAKWGHEE